MYTPSALEQARLDELNSILTQSESVARDNLALGYVIGTSYIKLQSQQLEKLSAQRSALAKYEVTGDAKYLSDYSRYQSENMQLQKQARKLIEDEKARRRVR